MSYIVILMSFTAIFPSIGYGQTKHNPTQTAFHTPHAMPLPYMLTASSVKAISNKSFYILTIVTI
jgi:hypothetical protein